MKKGLFLILFAFFAMSNVNAQLSLGGGVLLTNNTAVEFKADFGLSQKLSISPSFDYFLLGKKYASDASMYMLGVDAHYSFGNRDAFDFYPLLGVNFFKFSNSGSKASTTGLTAGGGISYALLDSIKLYGEAKYLHKAFGASLGILFSL